MGFCDECGKSSNQPGNTGSAVDFKRKDTASQIREEPQSTRCDFYDLCWTLGVPNPSSIINEVASGWVGFRHSRVSQASVSRWGNGCFCCSEPHPPILSFYTLRSGFKAPVPDLKTISPASFPLHFPRYFYRGNFFICHGMTGRDSSNLFGPLPSQLPPPCTHRPPAVG